MELELSPFLFLNGRGNEAIEFYKEALDAQVIFKQTKENPKNNTSGKTNHKESSYITYSIIKIGKTNINISDIFPGMNYVEGNQVSICINIDDVQRAKHIYEKLVEGGEIISELKKTHFSPAHALIKDKFGVIFQIYTTTK